MLSNHLILCPPLASCPQSFPASGSFPMTWHFTSGGQSTGASASVPPIQGWFPLGLTGLISLQSKRLWRVFSSTTIHKHQYFSAQPFLWTNCTHFISHCIWWLEKPEVWLYRPFPAKWYLYFLICCLGTEYPLYFQLLNCYFTVDLLISRSQQYAHMCRADVS